MRTTGKYFVQAARAKRPPESPCARRTGGINREHHQARGGGIDVRLAGELPKRQRVPRVKDHALRRKPIGPEPAHDGPDDYRLEGEHDELDAGDAVADGHAQCKEHLGERRVDGDRDLFQIDVRIDGGVTQMREFVCGRNPEIRVEPGPLDAPVPDIAVGIGGQALGAGNAISLRITAMARMTSRSLARARPEITHQVPPR